MTAPDGVDVVAVVDRVVELDEELPALDRDEVPVEPPRVVHGGLAVLPLPQVEAVEERPGGDEHPTGKRRPRRAGAPVLPSPVPGPPGADARTILAGIGLADRWDDLVRKGVVLPELPAGTDFIGRFRPPPPAASPQD